MSFFLSFFFFFKTFTSLFEEAKIPLLKSKAVAYRLINEEIFVQFGGDPFTTIEKKLIQRERNE